MSARKRKVDDGVESGGTKLPCVDSSGAESEHTRDRVSTGFPPENPFKIEIKLRSASKAARNDPKSADSLEEPLESLLGLRGLDNNIVHGTSEAFVSASPKANEITSTGQGTSQPNLADPMEDVLNTPDTNSEQSVEDDESETYSDRSEYDAYAGFKWLEAMDGLVTDNKSSTNSSTKDPIGYCHAKLIRRGEIRSSFYHQMEAASRETCILAFEVFDRYGRLRSEVKDHVVRKGSGVWNEELDSGDILLIEYVRVKKEFRRQGLGTKLVRSMVDKAREKSRQIFAISWPIALNSEVAADVKALNLETEAGSQGLEDSECEDQIRSRADAASIQFHRSLGFRRIGSTRWFGFACETDHPSRLLASEDDYNRPEPLSSASELKIQSLQQSLVHSSDQECLTALSNYLQQNPATSASWQGTDPKGNTLLHLACLNFKAASVKWIMRQEFGPKMLEERNHKGDLPLEAILFELEDKRIRLEPENTHRTFPVSDKFNGHSDAAVRVLIALKQVSAPTALDRARLAFGCTCGECVAGFLSPRMSLALLCQAEIRHDALSESTESMSGPEWVSWWEDSLQYLPRRVRENLKTNKSMRQGFANTCDHIANCLRAKTLPNVANILDALDEASEWPPVTKNFLQRGGSIESVALTLFQGTMDEDALAGCGMHEEIFSKEIAKLPECRNDHEFGFVSGMCGYKRIAQIHYVPIMGGLLGGLLGGL